MNLPSLIRRVRTSLGLTQIEFAKRLKITQPAVAHLEKGTKGLSVKSARRLLILCAKVDINITLEELV